MSSQLVEVWVFLVFHGLSSGEKTIVPLLNECTMYNFLGYGWMLTIVLFMCFEGGVAEKMINILLDLGRMLYLSMRLRHSLFWIRNP